MRGEKQTLTQLKLLIHLQETNWKQLKTNMPLCGFYLRERKKIHLGFHLPKHPALGPNSLALCVCKVRIILPKAKHKHNANMSRFHRQFQSVTLLYLVKLSEQRTDNKHVTMWCKRVFTSLLELWWYQQTGSDTSSEHGSQERWRCAWGRMCSTLLAVEKEGNGRE